MDTKKKDILTLPEVMLEVLEARSRCLFFSCQSKMSEMSNKKFVSELGLAFCNFFVKIKIQALVFLFGDF